MLKRLCHPDYRILVTGSRGKSSVTRLLHASLNSCGIKTFARITGVVPRELGPKGCRTIIRTAGAHVEEMRWWLRQLPASAKGVVLENSAIAPDLQLLAGKWLKPQVIILTNTYPDHQEVWGPTSSAARNTLLSGIPMGCRVVLPFESNSDSELKTALDSKRCHIVFSDPLSGKLPDHREVNINLALAAVKIMRLDTQKALQSMFDLKPDRYDFRKTVHADSEFALAFTANDIKSTINLFTSLDWKKEETRLVFNHRSDRSGRILSFAEWIDSSDWRDVLIIGDKPGKSFRTARYLDVRSMGSFFRSFQPGDKIFGCGNFTGLPPEVMTGLYHQ
ncbi:hypothetical protein KJ966_08265 [bacterium]|nr:hypothetical protein [bacterium]